MTTFEPIIPVLNESSCDSLSESKLPKLPELPELLEPSETNDSKVTYKFTNNERFDICIHLDKDNKIEDIFVSLDNYNLLLLSLVSTCAYKNFITRRLYHDGTSILIITNEILTNDTSVLTLNKKLCVWKSRKFGKNIKRKFEIDISSHNGTFTISKPYDFWAWTYSGDDEVPECGEFSIDQKDTNGITKLVTNSTTNEQIHDYAREHNFFIYLRTYAYGNWPVHFANSIMFDASKSYRDKPMRIHKDDEVITYKCMDKKILLACVRKVKI